MNREEVFQALEDAGCRSQEIETVMGLYTDGNAAKAQKLLLEHRKKLLDRIHTDERRIECLDYLMYQMDQPRKTAY